MAQPIVVIAGVGPGTGTALAHKFAAQYPVALLARTAANYEDAVKDINSASASSNGKTHRAIGIQTDIGDRQSVIRMVETLKKEFVKEEGQELRVAAAIFNVSGGFVRKPFLELTPEEWERGWDGSVRTSFNFAQLLLPHLLVHRDTLASSSGSDNHDQHPPTLLFTGATASFKGSANFAAFASPKFGLRATAQSLAREYGPKGVHVAHIVVDGVIDIPRTHGWDMGPEGKIDPNAIADAYWWLHTQPRTAFTFEIDIRPAKEKW